MNVADLAAHARVASGKLAALGGETRSAVLEAIAAMLRDSSTREELIVANQRDMDAAAHEVALGRLNPAVRERLRLDTRKLDTLAAGSSALARQRDLVDVQRVHRELAEGLVLEQRTRPLGVLGVVFESRPDALPQITALALRTANAVLLKGGKEAHWTNATMVRCIHTVLREHDLPTASVSLLEGRDDVRTLLGLHDAVDLVIARGSSTFVEYVRANTRIPVMAHAAGNCHAYLHAAADVATAVRVVVDSKCDYPAACNAIETLLWDAAASDALDACVHALVHAGVELRGCPTTCARHPHIQPATADDWAREYGERILAVRCVADLDEALAHIAVHGSHHTETIVTRDDAVATRFFDGIDAACVFHNASTRFADGYRFGLGAEVGISTDKLHARGPVGTDGLLTYQWRLRGHGDAAADFAAGTRKFTHRDL